MGISAGADRGGAQWGQPSPPGPLVPLACCWIAGTILSRLALAVDTWLVLGSIALIPLFVMVARRRPRGVRVWAHVAIVMIAAAWASFDQHYIEADDIRRFITKEPQLVRIEGSVKEEPWLSAPQVGAFAAFSYQPPRTLFSLRVRSIFIDNQWRSARGELLVKIQEADAAIREGTIIRTTGWLKGIDGPDNPGEFDYRPYMERRGIQGRLTLARRGNWQALPSPDLPSRFARWRHRIREAASGSLRLGMDHDLKRSQFLNLILLGQRSRGTGDLHLSFRRVGLAHLLSISGAHLGILIGLTWLVVKVLVRNPPRAALIVLIVLAMYLAMVPMRVPIVRAALMAGLFLIGYATGKRIVGLDLVALAAVFILIWKPSDLFTTGFQLSFGVVAALLQFTRRVSGWLWPMPTIVSAADRMRVTLARWLADYVSVNLVAFLTAMPFVAYHYALVSPLTVLLSILALPVVTATLGLGYLKMLCGLVLPSVGLLLAGPTAWIADAMVGLVDHASSWPGVAVELRATPSLYWTLATLAVMLSLVSGRFAARKKTAAVSVLVCLVWLFVSDRRLDPSELIPTARRPALRLNMLAVGDGSCYLMRTNGYNVMFDCGSQAYLHVGSRTVLPTLRQLGVRRIDTLMLSHADLDHFCGTLDVADHLPIDRILMPPQFMREAKQDEGSASSFLIKGLKERGIRIEAISRGWSESWGSTEARVLWPPEALSDSSDNDTSLVLSVRCAGRHVLLTGDIQQYAITELLNTTASRNGELRADVCELPHHGSFVEASPRWLEAVQPLYLLQSSSQRRLDRDRWGTILQETHTQRLISAHQGMVEVIIARDGSIRWSSFKKPADLWSVNSDVELP